MPHETSWLYFLGHGTHQYPRFMQSFSSLLLFFKMINFILSLSSNAFILTHKLPTYCIYLDVCIWFWKFSVCFCACFNMHKVTNYLQYCCYVSFIMFHLTLILSSIHVAVYYFWLLHTFPLCTFYFFIWN